MALSTNPSEPVARIRREPTPEVAALALVISNAYLARHGLDPATQHAPVDEDIAEAILDAGYAKAEGLERVYLNSYTDPARRTWPGRSDS